MSRPWTAETVTAAAPRSAGAAYQPAPRCRARRSRATIRSPSATCCCCASRWSTCWRSRLLGAIAGQGWIGQLLAAEGSGYSIAIALVFAAGLILSGHRVGQLNQALNEVRRFELDRAPPAPAYLRAAARADGQSRALLASSLKLKLVARIAPVKHIANSLVLLGLIGTVIGFIVALAGRRARCGRRRRPRSAR